MSLLTLCQAACNAVPEAAPSSIVGNTTNETAILLLALANDAGEALSNRNPGSWAAMNREFNFATVNTGPFAGIVANVAGQAVITLTETPDPPAPGAAVALYAWVITGSYMPNNAVIVGIDTSTPGLWVFTTNLPATQEGPGQFYFSLTDYALPADFERPIDGTFWDRTRYWQMRGALSPQQWQLYRSSVYGKATIQRRWRIRNSDWLSSASGTPTTNVLSIDPVPVDDGANLVFEYVSNGWCASASTGARQSQWLADTDVGVVPEYLLRLSVKWRLLRRRGLSYSEELDEYEREVDKAVARDGGTAVLDMTPAFGLGLVSPLNIQDGNFPGGPVS